VSNQDADESITARVCAGVIISESADAGLAEVDVALTTLCQMLTRAVNAPDLPNVRRFSERIDELLDARITLTRDLQPQGVSCTPST
jgi:hypothetical protein